MPEFERPEGMRPGAPASFLDNLVIRRELFFLTAIFVADGHVNSIAHIEDHHPVLDLWNELQGQEIAQRLASTAAFLRARDDHFISVAEGLNPRDAEWSARFRAQTCGTLQPDRNSETTIGLTLREACNKIMHATTYNFDVHGQDPNFYIVPTVYLYGTKNRLEWRAVLDVLKYVEIGARYTDMN